MKPVVLFGLLALVFFSCSDDNTCQPVETDSANRPPVLQAQRDTSVIIGDTLRLTASATDPNGDEVKYYLTVGLRDASDTAAAFLDSLTGRFWFAPSIDDRPERSMMFTAVDERGSAISTLFDVSVSYHVDQRNDFFQDRGGFNVQSDSPVGQEFTPQLGVLDFVELGFWGGNIAGEIVVNIRSETIRGEILGSSSPVLITTGSRGIALFEFQRITLAPNELHVIEVVQLSGFNILIVDSGGPNSTYPDGRIIRNGTPGENNDLWFREGAKAPLPNQQSPGEW